ncbi:NAD(P)/FAD-dependent oxidoreductase [Leekyejoonella antrihumi]|uniref:NAD(P)/FAD-dependent oxidoreductase n=2 Tax=Leekyejoonella antrihumi TaxID=1660198 RepID=A0A563DUJ8_9MICO|nr:NAD(P)/FAD-dependent oxidoreductase [Leekyejoonella antrihumi]
MGYYLRRTDLTFAILDDAPHAGGSWQHMWDSLHLFSPAEHSPLPGWWMPRQTGEPYPTVDHVVHYLHDYEERYALPVHRPVRALGVHSCENGFTVKTDCGSWHARVVVNATGTWDSPHLPHYPGAQEFRGCQLHTVDYQRPEPFIGQGVAVVGGGNSAAQILAEVSRVAETTWVTARPPRFMPDDVDGRVLFDVATKSRAAGGHGVGNLGDIVMVRSVREARERGVLHARPMFDRMNPDGIAWDDGGRLAVDSVIWCTGFRPALDHLAPLDLTWADDRPVTNGTASVDHRGLFLVGYGSWTGPASATLIGVGRTAKDTVAQVRAHLGPAGRWPATH